MILKTFLESHQNEEVQISKTIKKGHEWLISQVAIVNDSMINVDLNVSISGRIYWLKDKNRWEVEWL